VLTHVDPHAITIVNFAWAPDLFFGIPSPHHWMSLALIGFLGACIGSFLNVVAHRFLTNQSIVSPPSHCPACQYKIPLYDNIPLISYALLMGKCRQCKGSIGIDAWLTELCTGLLFVATLWCFGWTWQTVFILFLLSQLVVIFLTDWKESLIFEINSLSLIPVGLLYNLLHLGDGDWPRWAFHTAQSAVFQIPTSWGDWVITYPILSAVIGIALAWVFFEGTILLSQKFLGTDGFGHGDTHLMMGVGAFLGWEVMGVALFLGFVIQTAIAIPWLVWRWLLQRKWVALFSAIGSVVFAVLPMAAQAIEASLGISVLTLTLISVVGSIACLLVFLRQLREQTEYVYVPLGPALIAASVLMLFAPAWVH
jgi:leader peptidase (prepilin peptidase)/N-methyltransferase